MFSIDHCAFYYHYVFYIGNQLLNRCPEPYSCGTYASLWSDETVPQEVGKVFNISVYSVARAICKHHTWSVQAMRCSLDTPHDIIYKAPGSSECKVAFCGMN